MSMHQRSGTLKNCSNSCQLVVKVFISEAKRRKNDIVVRVVFMVISYLNHKWCLRYSEEDMWCDFFASDQKLVPVSSTKEEANVASEPVMPHLEVKTIMRMEIDARRKMVSRLVTKGNINRRELRAL